MPGAAAAADLKVEALLAWLRTFDGVRVMRLAELADGLVLTRVFAEIVDESAEDGDDAGDAEERVFDLRDRLRAWYTREGADADDLMSGFDAEEVVDGIGAAVVALTELVLCVAVRCAKKAQYIGAIMRCDEEHQAVIMVAVEALLKRAAAAQRTPLRSAPADHTEAAALRRDLESAREEIARLKDAHAAAVEQRQAFAAATTAERDERGEELAAAAERLERGLHELSKAKGRLEESELENESLRAEVEAAKRKRRELDADLAAQETRQQALLDELDVARSRCGQVDRAEAHVEKLKRRIEDLNAQRKELREVDDQNAKYLADIVRLEKEVQRRDGTHADLERLREVVADRDREIFGLRGDVEVAVAELRRCRDDLDEAVGARAFFEDELNAKVAAEAASSPRHAETPFHEGDDDFSPVFQESAAELRAKVARLERQVRDLAAAGARPSDNTAAVLGQNTDLERALRDRERVALDARKAQAAAEAETAKVRKRLGDVTAKMGHPAPPPPGAAAPPVASSADLAEAQTQIAQLKQDREKLETYTRKTLQNVQEKYSVLVQTYKNQLQEKDNKITHLESQRKHDRTIHKREEQLMTSAIFDLGSRIIEHNMTEKWGTKFAPPDNAELSSDPPEPNLDP